MQIHAVDIAIIVIYMVVTVVAGLILTRLSARNIDSYFLGGKAVPWYLLGVANASGMFDITGTMLLVTWLFVYGVKGAWIPWIWPTFNQVILMIYLSVWLRRSNVMTGAEWIRTRFGNGPGAKLSDISVVIFALVTTIAFLAYAFQGIGKFSAVFLPWDLRPETYAIIIMGVTSVYIILGGMFGVLITNLIQFALLTVASVCIGVIAMSRTSAEQITAATPEGWKSLFFGWNLNLDWSGLIASVNDKISADGWSLFGIFFMMMLLKGILVSVAGPAPNYDMQRILSARTPKESALMSWFVSVVLYFPRYLMITGICVLGLVFYSGQLHAMGADVDFEQILPFVINNFIPTGLVGLILAGLLAAFMSTYSGTVNCGASYIVNDIYKRYINANAPTKKYVSMSYISSFLLVALGIAFGFICQSIDSVTQWIVGGLWGGYTAPNILKWYWWRLNGFGYFAGMVAGMAAAMVFALFGRSRDVLFGIEFNIATFPFILVFSAIASIVVSLLTQPDKEEVLKEFYRKVRPWGFWKPIHDKVVQENPEFRANQAFKRDAVNVAVGIVWQITLTLIPIYLIIRAFTPMWITIGVLVVTSVFLKKNWYDKLEQT
jgi:SSS family solute:Na+ symporter